MNTLKTAVLMTVLTVLLILVGSALGGSGGATLAFVVALAINGFSYWFSDKLVLRMSGARPATEAEAPELYAIVRDLAGRAGLPMPKVYLIESPTPNAFATGRNPSHAVVAVTTGMLDLLTRGELVGVLAHELSHIKRRDILLSTIAAAIAGAVTYAAQIAQWSMLFGGRDREEGAGGLLSGLVMIIVAPLAAMLVQMAISRSREYDADDGGARLSGTPAALASALRKLDLAARRMPMPVNPATAHLFIVNPLTGQRLLALFSTHPPIEDRIARLEAFATSQPAV
jgi:heat shock protein HtpX